MRIDAQLWHKWITRIIGLVLIGLFVFLIIQKIVPSKEKIYSMDFEQTSDFVYGPFPEGRVELEQGILQVNYEPIYFNVYSPRKFKRAQVKITYKLPEGMDARFGVKLDVNDWGYYLEPLPNYSSEWNEVVFEYDLSHARRTKNKLQFMLAAPGVGDSEEKILIDEVEIKLIK